MIEVGDEVEVVKDGKIYRGIVMPHHAFSKKNILIIKLPNGYNIGINLKGCKIRIIKKGGKKERKMGEIPYDEKKPTVALIGTGGTIASYVDYETGAVHPASTAEELAFTMPEIFDICNIEAKILFQKLSENIKPRDWQKMAREAAKYLNEGKSVVIAHGTDTMAYSSAALAFMLKNLNGAVVFVGSQRSSDRPSSDAFINLMAATKVALTDIGEVVIVMHSSISSNGCYIHRATKARKMHSSRRDAFVSINAKPIGLINEDKIEFYGEYRKKSKGKVKAKTKLNENVALIHYYPGMKREDFEKMIDGKDGIVIAGTGLGHVGEDLIPAIKKLTRKGIPVVITTQCLYGRVNLNVYSTGRKLIKAGVIEGEDMLPEVAWIKLMWVLANEKDVEKAMRKNMAGEISPRLEIDAKNFI
ncbi:MAG: Glu-tRNA(Gln) amidotransferase GatDE subunit D [Thermoplasmata archaeon]|nr:MAG: Glu-tRNA(Gln) amidotransferase GatDE subunit D [Thermoplasmata archaeon]